VGQTVSSMRRRTLALGVAVSLGACVAVARPGTGQPASPGAQWCAGTYDTAPHRSSPSLRFGIDSGVAGNPVPVGSVAPVRQGLETSALVQLRPHGRVLVVRLNRLFWSGGETLLQSFARRANALGQEGFQVEVQVRYHPTKAQEGNISGWSTWVRHVVDVLGANPQLVSLTITNEVNLGISPNTSDGSFARAKDALVRGIETAHDELLRKGWGSRVKVGFTFAYRFNPQTDAAFWQYLAQHGGERFRLSLGFVGLDDYPGTFYPPVLVAGSPAGGTPGAALSEAIATMRRCYLPMGAIPRSVPIWITENGFPSTAGKVGEARQRQALVEMITATRRVAATYGVTDYRWFNLRDNESTGAGMFDTDGLLRDGYARKPSFGAFRSLVAAFGAPA
jgi:hypothetical protein